MIHKAAKPHVYCLFNFSREPQTVPLQETENVSWKLILNTASATWGGAQTEAEINSNTNQSITLQPESLLILQS